MQGTGVQSLVRELDPTCHNLHPVQTNKYLKKKKEGFTHSGGRGRIFSPDDGSSAYSLQMTWAPSQSFRTGVPDTRALSSPSLPPFLGTLVSAILSHACKRLESCSPSPQLVVLPRLLSHVSRALPHRGSRPFVSTACLPGAASV